MRTTIPKATSDAPCLSSESSDVGESSLLPRIDAFDVQQHGEAEKDQPETETHRHPPNRPN